MTTISEIKDRLVTLCGLIQLPTLPLGQGYLTDPEEPLTDDLLPAFVVRDTRGLDYRLEDRGEMTSYLTTREMTITAYISRMDDESYEINSAAQSLAEDCIQPLVRFFIARPTLAYNDNGIVRQCRIANDTGARTLPIKRVGNSGYVKYRGVLLRLRVSFIDSFNESDYQ